MTNVAAMGSGLQTVSSALNRVVLSPQVNANRFGSNFSEVLGAGTNGPQTRENKVVESKLTGMLIGNFVQMMLPKETEGLFGEKQYANMWSSFLANALAENMNASGKIDLRIGNR